MLESVVGGVERVVVGAGWGRWFGGMLEGSTLFLFCRGALVYEGRAWRCTFEVGVFCSFACVEVCEDETEEEG